MFELTDVDRKTTIIDVELAVPDKIQHTIDKQLTEHKCFCILHTLHTLIKNWGETTSFTSTANHTIENEYNSDEKHFAVNLKFNPYNKINHTHMMSIFRDLFQNETRMTCYLKNRYVSTSCPHGNDEYDYENANIWIYNPKWIDLKMDPCNPGLSWPFRGRFWSCREI